MGRFMVWHIRKSGNTMRCIPYVEAHYQEEKTNMIFISPASLRLFYTDLMDLILKQFISLVLDQERFQSRADKLIDGPLYLFPVCAVIAQHDFIDSQAAVHLKIKYGFGLFEGEKTV